MFVDRWSDLKCTKKYALTERAKQGWGEVNVGHSLRSSSHFMLATGLSKHINHCLSPIYTSKFSLTRKNCSCRWGIVDKFSLSRKI